MRSYPTGFHLFVGCILALAGKMPAAQGETAAVVGDERLAIRISISPNGLQEAAFSVEGKPLTGLTALGWAARVDGQESTPRDARISSALPQVGIRTHATFEGTAGPLQWRLTYARTGTGRVTKTLTLTAVRDLVVEQITLWRATDPTAPVVPRTSLQDIAALYRFDDRGLFASLDFPYSLIDSGSGTTAISYPPFRRLAKGETYEAHSLTIGATTLTHRLRSGHDTGEIDAMDRYVQERFTPRFERPMILSCSIVNRYTQVRGDVIFYTMKDHPTLRDNTDLLERELALMPALGVEWYQVFPGVFDWGPDDPRPADVTRLMDVARRNHVRMGDYSGASVLFCAHYNEYHNSLNRPEWLIHTSDDKPTGAFCFGNPAFVDHYLNTVVPNCRRYGFEMHCLDFLSLAPCHATNHGHPAGRDSLYAQVAGLVRLLDAINAVSPDMLTWSNSGNWGELLPKLAWSNPNLYLTDPFISTPWQGLNMTRLLDDARREQMVSLHNARFIPYRFLTNCQYFFSQNSIVPDIRHYEYGTLSTLAVTPNLCLGEIRPWLDRLADADRQHVFAFYRHWTEFVGKHFDLWKRTYQAGSDPGPGSLEIYSHAAGNHGYVFLVNPQYWSQTATVPLDATLGFAGNGECEIAELYPVSRLRLVGNRPPVVRAGLYEPGAPASQKPAQKTTCPVGNSFTIDVPPQQVIVLEIRPAPAATDLPRLYGVPGTVERDGSDYLVKTHGPQGDAQPCVILIPPGRPAITAAEVRTDVPRIPKRLVEPTKLDFTPLPQGGAMLNITFRRARAPDELRDWTVRPGDLNDGLAAHWDKHLTGGESVRFPLFDGATGTLSASGATGSVSASGATGSLSASGATGSLSASAADTGRQAARGTKLGPLADFCGGYIENALSESQETWIRLRTDGKRQPTPTMPADARPTSAPAPAPLALATDPRTEWWLQTRFNLPFMYMIGAEPAFDEHTILILPMLKPAQVKRVSAWINGVPLDVRFYRYPRNRGLGCHYADLVGSGAVGGENVLTVQLTY